MLDCRYVAISTMCLALGSQRDADAAVNLNHIDFAYVVDDDAMMCVAALLVVFRLLSVCLIVMHAY